MTLFTSFCRLRIKHEGFIRRKRNKPLGYGYSFLDFFFYNFSIHQKNVGLTETIFLIVCFDHFSFTGVVIWNLTPNLILHGS